MNLFSSQVIETGSASQECYSIMSNLFEDMLDSIHPDALVLMESWGFTDDYLNSTLGHSNGKPYENLMHVAKTYGQLNKIDIHPAMLEYIKAQNQAKLEKNNAKL